MFVEASATVDLGIAEVEAKLVELRRSLEEWADVAYRDGEQLSSRVGPNKVLAKEVQLHIGMAEILSSGIVYSVHWSATGATMLFPELNADLVLKKNGSNSTVVTLKGTYEPPLGFLGRVADRAGLDHLAKATVSSWLDRVVDGLNPVVTENE